MSTITLNDLIKTRLDEISYDVWWEHRVMAVKDGSGRVLQLGSGAVREQWFCQADHGSGPCNEPLLTHDQASTLLGMVTDDGPVPAPKTKPVEIELLDPTVGGFLLQELYHFSDVVAEFEKAQD